MKSAHTCAGRANKLVLISAPSQCWWEWAARRERCMLISDETGYPGFSFPILISRAKRKKGKKISRLIFRSAVALRYRGDTIVRDWITPRRNFRSGATNHRELLAYNITYREYQIAPSNLCGADEFTANKYLIIPGRRAEICDNSEQSSRPVVGGSRDFRVNTLSNCVGGCVIRRRCGRDYWNIAFIADGNILR